MSSLDLVLPCYNPAPGWTETIIQNIQELKSYLPETEIFIFIVNDGSTKNAKPEEFEFLKQIFPQITFLTYSKNQGKGFALRTGINEAIHDVCIYTDVDFPYTAQSISQVYHTLISQKSDVVIGFRDKHYYRNLTQSRTLISKFLRIINQNVLQLPVTDTQCGLKGFNQKGRAVFLRTKINRYLFDLEFILLVAKNPQIKLSSVPVELRTGIVFKKMNWKIALTESTSLLKLLFQGRKLF